jgi:hypothetical protein
MSGRLLPAPRTAQAYSPNAAGHGGWSSGLPFRAPARNLDHGGEDFSRVPPCTARTLPGTCARGKCALARSASEGRCAHGAGSRWRSLRPRSPFVPGRLRQPARDLLGTPAQNRRCWESCDTCTCTKPQAVSPSRSTPVGRRAPGPDGVQCRWTAGQALRNDKGAAEMTTPFPTV